MYSRHEAARTASILLEVTNTTVAGGDGVTDHWGATGDLVHLCTLTVIKVIYIHTLVTPEPLGAQCPAKGNVHRVSVRTLGWTSNKEAPDILEWS